MKDASAHNIGLHDAVPARMRRSSLRSARTLDNSQAASVRSVRRHAFDLEAFAPTFQQEAILEANEVHGASPGGFGPRARRAPLTGMKTLHEGDDAEFDPKEGPSASTGMDTLHQGDDAEFDPKEDPSAAITILPSSLQDSQVDVSHDEQSLADSVTDNDMMDDDEIVDDALSAVRRPANDTARRLSALLVSDDTYEAVPMEEYVAIYLDRGGPWYIRAKLNRRCCDALHEFVTKRRPCVPPSKDCFMKPATENESEKKSSKAKTDAGPHSLAIHVESSKGTPKKHASGVPPEQWLRLESLIKWLAYLTLFESFEEFLMIRHPATVLCNCCHRAEWCHSKHKEAKWRFQGVFFGTFHVLVPAATCAFASYAQVHFAWGALLPGSGDGGVMERAVIRAIALVLLQIAMGLPLPNRIRILRFCLVVVLAPVCMFWLTAFSVFGHDERPILDGSIGTPYAHTDAKASLRTVQTFVLPSVFALIFGPCIVYPILRLLQTQLLINFSEHALVRHLAKL